MFAYPKQVGRTLTCTLYTALGFCLCMQAPWKSTQALTNILITTAPISGLLYILQATYTQHASIAWTIGRQLAVKAAIVADASSIIACPRSPLPPSASLSIPALSQGTHLYKGTTFIGHQHRRKDTEVNKICLRPTNGSVLITPASWQYHHFFCQYPTCNAELTAKCAQPILEHSQGLKDGRIASLHLWSRIPL